MIYLKDRNTNEIKETYDNVIAWGDDFVEYYNNGNRAKFYCGDDEYFTDADKLNEELENENNEQ